jgi:hypothetical protein
LFQIGRAKDKRISWFCVTGFTPGYKCLPRHAARFISVHGAAGTNGGGARFEAPACGMNY